jgi:hypothetical protein
MKNASIASNLIYNKYNKIEFENEVFNIDHLNASHLETILDILRDREMWNSSIERIFGLAIFTLLKLHGFKRFEISNMLKQIDLITYETAEMYAYKVINGNNDSR